MDKFCVKVGIGMLFAPFLLGGLILILFTLIGFGISAFFGICVFAYIAVALFLILNGCTSKDN